MPQLLVIYSLPSHIVTQSHSQIPWCFHLPVQMMSFISSTFWNAVLLINCLYMALLTSLKSNHKPHCTSQTKPELSQGLIGDHSLPATPCPMFLYSHFSVFWACPFRVFVHAFLYVWNALWDFPGGHWLILHIPNAGKTGSFPDGKNMSIWAWPKEKEMLLLL